MCSAVLQLDRVEYEDFVRRVCLICCARCSSPVLDRVSTSPVLDQVFILSPLCFQAYLGERIFLGVRPP